MKLWTEEQVGFGGADTHAVRLRWHGRGSYRLSLPETDLTGRALAFDLCDLDSAAVERGELSLTDAEVVLTDASGVEASARISDFTTVFPILAVRTDKLDFLFDTCVYKRAFATAAIPAEGFLSQESFDFSRVVGISFVFDGSGQVLLDNIGVGG